MLTPRTWARDRDWYDHSRLWHLRPTADLHGAVSPHTVEAASGHTFTVTLTCGPTLTLPTGAHLTVELPESWDTHLGNCYRRGIHTIGARSQIQPGYGAFIDVTASTPDVTLDAAVYWGRFFDLVNVVVTAGALRPGDSITLTLGTPDGNLVQAQKYAQVAILTTGVDPTGEGVYLQAATHPTVRVTGAAAQYLRVFAPGAVTPGEPFPIRILPVDLYSHNRSPSFSAQVHTFPTPGLSLPSVIDVTTTDSPQATTITATVTQPSTIHRLTVLDPRTGISGRSNPIGAAFFHPDPPASSNPSTQSSSPAGPLSPLHVYFGEMHSQMWHSMGTGTTTEFFTWGRDVACLDFCAPANHYNHRMEATPEVWQEVVDTANAFNQPGRFATLVSYEWGGTRGSGHKNVYYRGTTGEFAPWYKGVHAGPEDLWKSLEGRDVLTIPHHTKFGGMTDWSFRNDRHQRLVEICSLWGISEEGGPYSVQSALAMGHRLGFVGGTDSHYGLANQGSYHVNDGNGLACVIAPTLTRDAIWQSLHDRHCYATTGDRILLDLRLSLEPVQRSRFNVQGDRRQDHGEAPPEGRSYPMGTDLPLDLASAGPRTFTIRIAGTHHLDTVEILRNNHVVFSATPATEDFSTTWTDTTPAAGLALQPTFPGDRPFLFYYLRLRQKNRQQAWSSPIWLTHSPA